MTIVSLLYYCCRDIYGGGGGGTDGEGGREINKERETGRQGEGRVEGISIIHTCTCTCNIHREVHVHVQCLCTYK